MPASANLNNGGSTGVVNDGGAKYAYNDGDGSTRYDVEYPIQMMGFDPNFHYVGMTFNPEAFADMKDKYFMLSGRSYPDTINTASSISASMPAGIRFQRPDRDALDGVSRPSQPQPTLITLRSGNARCCASPTST